MDTQLALLFSVEAAVSVLSRLEILHLDLDLGDDTVRALRDDVEWTNLRREVGTAVFLESAGRAVVAAHYYAARPSPDDDARAHGAIW